MGGGRGAEETLPLVSLFFRENRGGGDGERGAKAPLSPPGVAMPEKRFHRFHLARTDVLTKPVEVIILFLPIHF